MAGSSRRVVSALLLVVHLAGCQVWQNAGPTPAEYVATHQPGQIRISRANFPELVLIEPSIRGDSLHGFPESGGTVSLALSDIDSVAVRRTSWVRTLGLVGAVAGGVAIAALLSNCNDARSFC